MASPDHLDADQRRPEFTQIRELQLVELQILLDVASVCERLGIEFFLGEGTLLGAVRHGGFIPWDDDVDLLMRRAHYERFLREAPALLGERYTVQSTHTVRDYWSPFAKVRLVDAPQKFRQRHIAHLTSENGPLVDIFPMDGVPSNRGAGLRLQYGYLRVLRGALAQKLRVQPACPPSRLVLRALATFVSVDVIQRQIHWASTLHREPQPYVANLASYHSLDRQVVPAAVYSRAVPMSFEGHDLPVPVGYHELLTTVYGDYLVLPPEDERNVRHHFSLGGAAHEN